MLDLGLFRLLGDLPLFVDFFHVLLLVFQLSPRRFITLLSQKHEIEHMTNMLPAACFWVSISFYHGLLHFFHHISQAFQFQIFTVYLGIFQDRALDVATSNCQQGCSPLGTWTLCISGALNVRLKDFCSFLISFQSLSSCQGKRFSRRLWVKTLKPYRTLLNTQPFSLST